MTGRLRRRLLVNAIVEPEEAGARLPVGLRPHLVDGGTVVGCCLLEIESLRPAGLPAVLGVDLRAAAHRISAEWEDPSGRTVIGVYVPERRTDSRMARAIGGRWFPGVHRPARIEIIDGEGRLAWSVKGGDCSIEAIVRSDDRSLVDLSTDAVGGACIGADVGLSPAIRHALEGARMDLSRREARAVSIERLRSSFIDGFTTARPSMAYLMEDIAVRWSAADAPDDLRRWAA
jgi:hypothetical protein